MHKEKPWHSQSSDSVAIELSTDIITGLSGDEVIYRQQKFGLNTFTEHTGAGPLKRFLLLRLIKIRDLQIDKSTLTGESVPVEKDTPVHVLTIMNQWSDTAPISAEAWLRVFACGLLISIIVDLKKRWRYQSKAQQLPQTSLAAI